MPSPLAKVPKPLTRYEVPILAHTLRVLEALAASDDPIRLQELATQVGASKSSVFRIAATLEAHGYVERSAETGGYRIGSRVLELAEGARRRDVMRDRALPHLQGLQARFAETVNLGALRGNRLVYVEVLESGHAFRMVTPAGAEVPPHASALGKAILAFQAEGRVKAVLERAAFEPLTPNTITSREGLRREFERVRRTGVATDEEEVEVGATCVAVPIRDSDGAASYAISVAGPTGRIAARRREIVAELKKACRALGSGASRRA